MQKLLFRRVLRNFRDNRLRYLTLLFLVTLAVFLVIATVGAAYSMIATVDQKGRDNHLEDGQFSLFLPLKAKQMEDIKSMGVLLEPSFYIDVMAEDGSTLRVMKERRLINLLELEQGQKTTKSNEMVLEQVYASTHKLKLGDELILGKDSFKITGFASTPDYDHCLRNLSDMAADGESFGTAFVSDQSYEKVLHSESRIQSENYTYSYILKDGATHEKLKDYLKKLEINSSEVEDPYFQEMVEEQSKSIRETSDALENLRAGSASMLSAIKELEAGSQALYEHMSRFQRVMGRVPALSEAYEGLYEGMGKLRDGSRELSEHAGDFDFGIRRFYNNTQAMIDESFSFDVENLYQFVQQQDNPRIKASNDDVQINYDVGLFAGIVVMILITYVISIFVVHSIEEESAQIGALYALGVEKKQLLFHYIFPPVLICLIGGVCGTLLGFSPLGMELTGGDVAHYFSVPTLEIHRHPGLLMYGTLMPPLVAFFVTRLVIKKRLNRSALSLLRADQKLTFSQVNLKTDDFVRNFRLRQILREKRSCAAILGGMFISLLILILGVNCYVLCRNIPVNNIADTHFEYMYHYKYPTQKPPEGGQAVYAKTLQREKLGYTLDVTLIGMDAGDNRFFPKISSKGQGNLSVSSSVASKFGLRPGDELVLYDKIAEKGYAFVVKEVVPYSVGLLCFMDGKDMRKLFGESESYYNVVYSSKKLEIPQGRLYGVNTKADIERNSKVFFKTMLSMVITMVTVSIILFLIVMYQMIKVMIDRSFFSIALMKIMGYNPKEIGKLYLGANFLVVVLGGLVLLPFAKLIMDLAYPFLIANVALGVDYSWPIPLYLAIYAGIILSFLMIRNLLLLKLRKGQPADILRAQV